MYLIEEYDKLKLKIKTLTLKTLNVSQIDSEAPNNNSQDDTFPLDRLDKTFPSTQFQIKWFFCCS